MSLRLKRRAVAKDASTQELARKLSLELEVPSFISQILISRGITSVEDAKDFLTPSLKRDWRNPYTLAGMEQGVDMLESAIRQNERIVVYGDFDLDGISATTVMTRAIRKLGGSAYPFIPKRFDEGYGITQASIERLLTLSPDLVVTVDCGISCANEVDILLDKGIKVVVTDHHEPSENTPNNADVPVIDPKAEESNPSAVLAGVGVALKVVQALGSRFAKPYLWLEYIDFATLGTIADLMPMQGENRGLVKEGIAVINNSARPAIEALKRVCKMEGDELSSTNIGFTVAPRLNAAGRMNDAEASLDLLMCDNFDECMMCAFELDKLNDERRAIERQLSREAEKQAKEKYFGERVMVLASKGWHEGVKGIVASRLAKNYKVPVILFTIEDGQARGSGRTYGEVDLFKAIESTSDLLERFGGHSAAVGVTLAADKLDEFKQQLIEYMNSLPPYLFEPLTEYDVVVNLEELSLENVSKLELLEPFGQQNPSPVFLARNITLTQCRGVGAAKNHLSCVLSDGKTNLSAIQFQCPDVEAYSLMECLVNVVFSVQIDQWRGHKSVKAMINHIEPVAYCRALDSLRESDDIRFVSSLFKGSEQSESISENSENTDKLAIKKKWQDVALNQPDMLKERIIAAIIGEGKTLHKAQSDMLSLLESGYSVLGIMATGRGKSLVFQSHAAMLALRDGKASLFVYPLRALMSDQAFHLSSSFDTFGLTCRVLSGETSQSEREEVYAGLENATVDIVLTTPEYLSFHAERIGRCRRIGFMVIDEAHHIGQARAGARPAYRELGQVAKALGNPVVLAVTATANDRIASDIFETLPVTKRVIDLSSRDNLHVDDSRGIPNRDDYLARIVAEGKKCIIYVNSREQSVGVARRLRSRVPGLASMIGFYNAGLNRAERKRVEALFRQGLISTLVATSAFGEGIDIPDIRHVVLYHMPFSDIEFNQMSGRAGRDGKDSFVHLLYGRDDVAINTSILSSLAPSRDDLAVLYRYLLSMQKSAGESCFSFSEADVLDKGGAFSCLSSESVKCGLAVFSELGLIEWKCSQFDSTESSEVRVVVDAEKRELEDSIRYREGLSEISEFSEFRKWAFKSDVESITMQITHPIAPSLESEV